MKVDIQIKNDSNGNLSIQGKFPEKIRDILAIHSSFTHACKRVLKDSDLPPELLNKLLKESTQMGLDKMEGVIEISMAKIPNED